MEDRGGEKKGRTHPCMILLKLSLVIHGVGQSSGSPVARHVEKELSAPKHCMLSNSLYTDSRLGIELRLEAGEI